MKPGRKRPRLAFVVTLSLPSALGCCPEKVTEGDACYFFQANCSEHTDGCGSNGFSCVKGKWREDFTYCNPPAFTPPPTSSSVPPGTGGAGATTSAAPSAVDSAGN
ncbi:MAG: hypothetical protein KC492_20655 [Myxococcales bacterium]|nr:hypothetical protein [Myxococcales bacterium]